MEKFSCTYFYIDKSLLIKEFLEEESNIISVTGPSRIGKTVNLTMMRYFFEMNYDDIRELLFVHKSFLDKFNNNVGNNKSNKNKNDLSSEEASEIFTLQ